MGKVPKNVFATRVQQWLSASKRNVLYAFVEDVVDCCDPVRGFQRRSVEFGVVKPRDIAERAGKRAVVGQFKNCRFFRQFKTP